MELEPLDPAASEPPFEQLRRQIASRAARGELAPGTRLPTVRALAAEAHLAVNTVARVYRELEADGVVVTEGRRGTFVAGTAAAGSADARRAAEEYAAGLRRIGASLAEAHKLLDACWPGALQGGGS
ncbi:GntR family transcriptional regulator [Nocardioides panaciterrulae]|uniref:DNA-binding transcriptional regulator YhcF (GntR family) n=1 Tax=Nocardioides panaciterrulae TaxID=661492 RepID=A0A7Y9E441_9ACTN|nr:GntR family transcriptional regulator [Nocardioides panaciterrulae]NYD40725.1 DNA-binding transcriptional regulator YhcF (GntR family) [Nocardioides panaciterrulae]